MSLYQSCLWMISKHLFKLRRNEKQIKVKNNLKVHDESTQINPFRFLPSKVIHDLVTTTLSLQKSDAFNASSLELLLTSGNILELRIRSKYEIDELVLSFQSLTTACRNLELLELTELPDFTYTDAPTALTELVRNSPNLKYIHSSISFDLKALKHCRNLKTVMLCFDPKQNYCDFLEDDQGNFRFLDSLEVFMVCTLPKDFQMDCLIPFLKYCPAIISFGLLNSSRALSQLYRSGIGPQIKLRCCCWGKSNFSYSEAEWVRDAIVYHPFVEELFISVYSIENISSLSNLKNLIFLDIDFCFDEDLNEHFNNALKDIGHQLKYLSLTDPNEKFPVDVTQWLENCANLEVLIINTLKFTKFAVPSVVLPNLKYLNINVHCHEEEQRLLSLFFDCNNIIWLSSKSFDDETLDTFMNKNSVSKLKNACFVPCSMTKRGFVKLFLSAPELKTIQASDFSVFVEGYIEREARKALIETNHKARLNDYTSRQKDAYSCHESQFGIYDEFVFKKRGCYLFRLGS